MVVPLVPLFRSLAFVVELPVDEEDVGVLDERFDEVREEGVELLEVSVDPDSDDDVGLAVSSDSDVEVLEPLVFAVVDAVVVDDVDVDPDVVPVEEGSVDEDEAPDVVDSVEDGSVDSVVEDVGLVLALVLVSPSVDGCPEVAAPASSSPMYM